ncbi:transketolase C-terminal domain-containing protein [Micropruina sp.]|uniref:transketolase C-terminal domain-containing protein n=1 Tax=Micropruina sp. TaxID=2737536 RepID=UPI0039E71953
MTGESLSTSSARTWTEAFGDELARIGATDDRVVAITAAMLHPTGLTRFAQHFPERTFDVGIAEQHALTSAAGLARTGLHPVVAIYATFLNRAFDQLLMDVALHGEGVTLVLDRAGITGPDGASHHGMWDLSLLGLIPGLQLAVPRDELRLQQALRACVGIDDRPTAIRFSKDPVPATLPAVRTEGALDVLFEHGDPRVLVVGWGQFATMAVEVGRRLAQQGIGVRVIDPVWALPIPTELVTLAGAHQLVITIEDGGLAGGLGSRLAQECRLAGVSATIREFGVPQRFIDHGTRAGILDELGLTAQQIARFATETVLAGEPVSSPEVQQPR